MNELQMYDDALTNSADQLINAYKDEVEAWRTRYLDKCDEVESLEDEITRLKKAFTPAG